MSKLIEKAKEIVESHWGQGAFEIHNGETRYCLLGACGHAFDLLNDGVVIDDLDYEFSYIAEHFRTEMRAIAESIQEADPSYDSDYDDVLLLWKYEIGDEVSLYPDEDPIIVDPDFWDEQTIDYIATWNDLDVRTHEEVLAVMEKAEERLKEQT